MVTTHAAIRYRDRVRPALSVDAARKELRHLIQLGTVGPRPSWPCGEERFGQRYLLIGDDVAFPIEDGYLVTCVVRGAISPTARQRRRDARKRGQRKRGSVRSVYARAA